MTKTMIEFFSGSGVMSQTFKENGYETFSIDNNPKLKPDLVINIMEFDISMLPQKFKNPTVIWASPPCNCFSIASVYRHWKNNKPYSEKCKLSIKLVLKTIDLIKTLNPLYFFIENPTAMLRTIDFMSKFRCVTITQCQYGNSTMKPTDIWTNSLYFSFGILPAFS